VFEVCAPYIGNPTAVLDGRVNVVPFTVTLPPTLPDVIKVWIGIQGTTTMSHPEESVTMSNAE
jgi:hypothetical protein